MMCNACLSQDRNLYKLGNYKEIYDILCRSIDLRNKSKILLCWECMSILRNIKEFLEKIKTSYFLLNRTTKDEQFQPICLSNLTVSETVTVDTFEEGEDVLHTDLKTELKQNHKNLEETTEYNNHTFIEQKDEADITKKDIDNVSHDENINERLLEQSETIKIEIEYDSQNCSNTKSKIQKPKIRNYPKERNKRYIMTYQSLKWEDVVEKIPINDAELKEWLERERNSEHFQSLKNKCDICLQKLRMDDDIWKHKKECHTATKSQPYACEICSLHFANKSRLRSHIIRHYFARHCSVCSYQCYSLLHMRYHLRKTHQRHVTCTHCGDGFKSVRDFYVHLRSHSAVDYYFCDQCEKRTRSLRNLETHIKRHHMAQRCEECDMTLKNHKQLTRHMRHKHTYNPCEESFCAPCDKQFHNVYLYKMHLLTAAAHSHERGHKRNKEVPCPVCLKVYSKNETMMNHYRWVHTKNSKYRCEQCNQSFLNRTKYKNHVQYVHMGLKKPKDKICKFCSRGFTTNQALGHHILTHTGEKPHACPLCPQRFRQKTAMRSHVKHVHERIHKNNKNEEIYVVIPDREDSLNNQESEVCLTSTE